jgi:hypothetical protein
MTMRADISDSLLANASNRDSKSFPASGRVWRSLEKNAEDEGEPFSESSHRDFRQFLSKLPLTRRPSVFLLENGALSAAWDKSEGDLVSLQFLGNGSIQYVFFRKPETVDPVDSDSGVDDFSGVMARLDNFKHLLI